jgi:hypothetical protein
MAEETTDPRQAYESVEETTRGPYAGGLPENG